MTIYIVTAGNPRLRDGDGTGAELFEKNRQITKFYRNKGHAEAAARKLAGDNPGELFGVFCVENLYEAKVSEIMEKRVDDQGQIVPRG